MNYETTPTVSDDSDESTQTYGNTYDELPGVAVRTAGRHDESPINVGGIYWKRSTVKVYPAHIVPGTPDNLATGWFVTGELCSPSTTGCQFHVFDAKMVDDITSDLGAECMYVPCNDGDCIAQSVYKYVFDEWDGGNR